MSKITSILFTISCMSALVYSAPISKRKIELPLENLMCKLCTFSNIVSSDYKLCTFTWGIYFSLQLPDYSSENPSHNRTITILQSLNATVNVPGIDINCTLVQEKMNDAILTYVSHTIITATVISDI